MDLHTIRVLEFGSIVDKLHELCWSVPAKRYEIKPSDNFEQILHSLNCLSEMVEIYQVDGAPPTLVFDDVDLLIEKCQAEGSVMEPEEMLKVAELYGVIDGFCSLDNKFENLNRLCKPLTSNPELAEMIGNTVNPPNEIKDSASPELKKIRRQLRQVRVSLEAKYNSYLDSDYSRYLSDNVVTIRDDRFVLPVREGDKAKVKGIVHDRSSTGATFFIEPLDAVEMNNNYRELQSAEKQEIFRILRKVTDAILAELDNIQTSIIVLTTLDIYSAKARYAIKMKCQRPELSSEFKIDLREAYHPLLRWRDKEKGTDNTIPCDFRLGEDFITLVITGPNTGGKTVTLKTVGLICLMAQSGMFVPAGEGSSVPVFRNIYADIGDEQSLEASLSTYSAHLTNIKNALNNADSECLVLLDEVGAGTDPDEGAALGQAIIENLADRKILSIVTTHHGKLKTLAVNHQNIGNGSLDFDLKQMKPVYKFRLGIPGLSYAIETARKLGLSDSITNRAEELIDKSERKLAGIITELTEKLQQADSDSVKAREKMISYEALIKIYSEKMRNLEKEQKQLKKQAFEEAEKEIKNARDEIDDLIKQAKKSDKQIEALRSARHQAQEKIEKVKKRAKEYAEPINKPAAKGKVGEKVYLPEMEAKGEIVEVYEKTNKVRVRVGNVVLQTDLDKLYRTDNITAKPKSVSGVKNFGDAAPGMEIDLRGMTFDEAEPVLEKYLYDAGYAGLHMVTVIHGKGTGALREKIHRYLKSSPQVESFRLGQWNEGSYGVTVVQLKGD